MSEEKLCLRCGNPSLVQAHVEHPMAFCVDHADYHGVLRLGMKASICQQCGHIEFWASDPSHIVEERRVKDAVVQEEDF